MSYKNYPIEALLRPPVEMYSVLIALLGSLLAIFKPYFFISTPQTGYLIALGFSLFALYRLKQGWHIIQYHCNLKRLPRYFISSNNIPVNDQKLFLGRGFYWESKHTQRLRDLDKVENAFYKKISSSYEFIRTFEKKLKGQSGLLKKIGLFLGSQHVFNPFKPLPDVGGSSVIHGVELKEKDIFMNLSERVGHMIVLGATRVGKTRFLEVLAAQDIRRGEAVIVFDPKGDGDLLRRIYFEAKQCGREDDMLIFHLGHPEVSARYNPIGSFARITEVANRVANQLPSSGESAAFKEFAWRFVNIIAKTLIALSRKPDYRQIQRYILNVDPLLEDYCQQWLSNTKSHEQWESEVKEIAEHIKSHELPPHMRTRSFKIIALYQYVQKHGLHNRLAEDLFSAFNYDKTYFDKITASLLPLIEKLTTGQMADLISPNYNEVNDTRPIFEWMQVIKTKKIVYVGLDAMSDSTVATAVGSSMFSDLCSVAGQLYKNKQTLKYRICVYADEFNEIANDDVTTVLNKGGGAGFELTLFTQTWADVEVRLGSKAKSEQVSGNLNTIVCLRALDEETANYFTHKLSQRILVKDLIQSSSVSDSPTLNREAHFTSQNEDHIVTQEVPTLMPSDLLEQPKGQSFFLTEGGRLGHLRSPLLPKIPEDAVPEYIGDIAAQMKNRANDDYWQEVSHVN